MKVGDRVKITTRMSYRYGICGKIIKITEHPAYPYDVNFEDGGNIMYAENELELVPFKIGDYVEYIGDFWKELKGSKGQVTEVCSTITVRFGKIDFVCHGKDLKFLEENLKEIPNDSLVIKMDNVNSPSHYTQGKIQPIDYIDDQQLNFNLGNVVKYISRHGKKNGLEDLKKAKWYLEREISNMEKKNEN